MFVKYYYYTYMTTIFMPDFSQVLDFPQFNLNNGGELRFKQYQTQTNKGRKEMRNLFAPVLYFSFFAVLIIL